MKLLSVDIETYSSVDLQKCGLYKYAESPDFEIMLFGYSIDSGDVRVIDLTCGEQIPVDVMTALIDNGVIKISHNASFERVCISRFLGYTAGKYLSSASWRCSMVWSAYLGLPLSLKGAGEVIGLDRQKMDEGRELVRFFSQPVNGCRNMPSDAPDKWAVYKAYNKRDVEVELEIQMKLAKFPVPDEIWDEYHMSEEINDRGILVDMPFVKQAVAFDERSRTKLIDAMKRITELDNPNSVQQMKSWLAENGLETDTLGKKAVSELLQNAQGELEDVLTLRRQLAKSSVKKYTAMENSVCRDERARGMFMFYGANRTGRYSGRNIQLQNLPKNKMTDISKARELVKSGDYETLEKAYGDVPDTLSQLIRTAFIPHDGAKFIVCDFSAIEARVIAWLAGETWKSDAFARDEDIYCATASQMFKVPVKKHGINSELRQRGKVAELACGYGGSVGALKAMGAIEAGLTEDELQPLVNAWRKSNPNIVRFWYSVDRAVKTAVKGKTAASINDLTFSCRSGFLFIALPSGRQLAYVKPRIGVNRFGSESVTYEGVGTSKKWERIESYGAKFTENIVQGISRDILVYAMKTLRSRSIVAHVHDEIIIECDKSVSLSDVCEQMSQTPQWAEGLLLSADGYECDFYMKL